MPSDTGNDTESGKGHGLNDLERAAQARFLTISCGLDAATCAARDDLPPGTRSLLLLSPHEPAFWPAFTASAEWLDGQANPMDSWSARVIGGWAQELGAQALFPFGGPPFSPFLSWARASGRVFTSPVGMLVAPGMGLLTSFRGALALSRAVEVPPPVPSPCDGCAAPCLTRCPVSALGTLRGYDVPACKAHLRTAGEACLEGGCLARRACPAGAAHGRMAAHSAYHMRHFLGDTWASD